MIHARVVVAGGGLEDHADGGVAELGGLCRTAGPCRLRSSEGRFRPRNGPAPHLPAGQVLPVEELFPLRRLAHTCQQQQAAKVLIVAIISFGRRF